jgi:hypothetical protein
MSTTTASSEVDGATSRVADSPSVATVTRKTGTAVVESITDTCSRADVYVHTPTFSPF